VECIWCRSRSKRKGDPDVATTKRACSASGSEDFTKERAADKSRVERPAVTRGNPEGESLDPQHHLFFQKKRGFEQGNMLERNRAFPRSQGAKTHDPPR